MLFGLYQLRELVKQVIAIALAKQLAGLQRGDQGLLAMGLPQGEVADMGIDPDDSPGRCQHQIAEMKIPVAVAQLGQQEDVVSYQAQQGQAMRLIGESKILFAGLVILQVLHSEKGTHRIEGIEREPCGLAEHHIDPGLADHLVAARLAKGIDLADQPLAEHIPAEPAEAPAWVFVGNQFAEAVAGTVAPEMTAALLLQLAGVVTLLQEPAAQPEVVAQQQVVVFMIVEEETGQHHGTVLIGYD